MKEIDVIFQEQGKLPLYINTGKRNFLEVDQIKGVFSLENKKVSGIVSRDKKLLSNNKKVINIFEPNVVMHSLLWLENGMYYLSPLEPEDLLRRLNPTTYIKSLEEDTVYKAYKSRRKDVTETTKE